MTIERTADSIFARVPGVDPGTLKLFRKGKLPVEATLDLHHRTRPEAEAALQRFLAAAVTDHPSCVLVVHGKGQHSAGAEGAVLRPAVWDWLTSARARPAPLALVSAPAKHGGAGATLVLLPRRR